MINVRWYQSFSNAILFFHHRLFDALQTFFSSDVSTVQKFPLINSPFHRKNGNNNCVYEQFVILKNKNNSIQIRYNYSTHKSEYFSAPFSIACSTENMSFMRNILSLPISVCSIEFFKMSAYFLNLSIFTLYSLISSMRFASKPAFHRYLIILFRSLAVPHSNRYLFLL